MFKYLLPLKVTVCGVRGENHTMLLQYCLCCRIPSWWVTHPLGKKSKGVPQISSEIPEKSSDIPENKFKCPKISSDIVSYALFLVFGYI